MDGVQNTIKPQSASSNGSPALAGSFDPRLTPTPDYGTLGPDSDFAKTMNSAQPRLNNSTPSNSASPANSNVRALSVLAAFGGIIAALAVLVATRSGIIFKSSFNSFSANRSGQTQPTSSRDLEHQRPQKQAEILLTRALNHSPEANDEIRQRLQGWRGKIKLDSQLTQLTTAALNSDDTKVRISAVDVQLAAYGLEKNDDSVDGLVKRATSPDHSEKIWALWALGLLGNRGIESDRVVQALAAHLQPPSNDADDDSRRWAVEGLALVGSDATIAPLLRALHDDPSPMVRERAACSLAESGMLTQEQRVSAVAQLIDDSDDPALDSQTHAWIFQALTEITKQHLPNDAAAWRNWYQNAGAINHH